MGTITEANRWQTVNYCYNPQEKDAWKNRIALKDMQTGKLYHLPLYQKTMGELSENATLNQAKKLLREDFIQEPIVGLIRNVIFQTIPSIFKNICIIGSCFIPTGSESLRARAAICKASLKKIGSELITLITSEFISIYGIARPFEALVLTGKAGIPRYGFDSCINEIDERGFPVLHPQSMIKNQMVDKIKEIIPYHNISVQCGSEDQWERRITITGDMVPTVEDDNIKEFAQVILNMQKLESLTLKGGFNFETVWGDDISCLFNVLKRNPCLKELTLEDMAILPKIPQTASIQQLFDSAPAMKTVRFSGLSLMETSKHVSGVLNGVNVTVDKANGSITFQRQ